MGLIYLDTCLLIYLIEGHPRWGNQVARLVDELGDEHFVISSLVKCSISPHRRANIALEQRN